MTEKQKTIAKAVSLKGTGLHTGLESEITFLPAQPGSGYKFQRVDIDGKPVISAIVENVSDTSRGTAIESNGVKIFTVEHVLSAIAGLEIDNILIQINACEIPILDGSAKQFVDAIIEAGIIEQEEKKEYYTIKNIITWKDNEHGVEITAIPDHNYNLNILVDYNSLVVVNQYATLSSLKQYKDEIAQCRTFVFLHELEQLLKSNQ
ncbi:MAG: UDP-3-O-acyl-N-acetylglucosamine deacetylase, partial [Bacteroidia bacterium]|nr:UDP-3-O-acyl-N-acetylglucosamine deacetylase [Bacteroidia bacterium]